MKNVKFRGKRRIPRLKFRGETQIPRLGSKFRGRGKLWALDIRMSENTPAVFELSQLIELYTVQLQFRGVPVTNRIHSTRFKDRLPANCPDLTTVDHGKEIL